MVWPTFFAEAAARAVALATRTSLGVGGRPEFLFEPQSAEEALEIVQRCRRAGVPLRFLGGGTNLLVEDGVLAGAVMATRRLRALDVHEHAVRAEAGASFPGLVNRAAALQIPRLSGCPGIPGSVGGAVTMNAGGPRACTAEALLAVEGIDARGRPFRVDVTAEAFGYRASPFDGALVTAAWFRRDPSLDQALASATRREAFEEKRRRQPLGQRSAGCIFKNPEGASAGRLIDEAGLKGRREGHALVSNRHANFIVNEGRARAADIHALISLVRRRVQETAGQLLELEVRHWR